MTAGVRARLLRHSRIGFVIPGLTGNPWIPAFAGMTAGLRGDDGHADIVPER
jgi:hypothetical protein